MARNVEVKARLADPGALRSRLESLGAAGPHDLAQTDTFFNVHAGRLKLRECGDDGGELIFYERADTAAPKVSDYVRVAVPDAQGMRHAISRSVGIRATVRKRRSVYLLGQTRIHVDAVDGLGSFLELEVVLRDGQSASEGERIVAALLEALSIPAADLIPHAYVDLLEQAPGAL